MNADDSANEKGPAPQTAQGRPSAAEAAQGGDDLEWAAKAWGVTLARCRLALAAELQRIAMEVLSR